MTIEKRYYTRYSVNADCIVGFETGYVFEAEIKDLSAEGAKIRTLHEVSLKVGDIIYLNIKGKYKLKLKAEIRWINKVDIYTYMGLKFIDVNIEEKQTLSQLLSELALSDLSDIYL